MINIKIAIIQIFQLFFLYKIINGFTIAKNLVIINNYIKIVKKLKKRYYYSLIDK